MHRVYLGFGQIASESDDYTLGCREGGYAWYDRALMSCLDSTVGQLCSRLHLGVLAVALATKAPPQDIQDLVEDIRIPNSRSAHGIADEGMAPAE